MLPPTLTPSSALIYPRFGNAPIGCATNSSDHLILPVACITANSVTIAMMVMASPVKPPEECIREKRQTDDLSSTSLKCSEADTYHQSEIADYQRYGDY